MNVILRSFLNKLIRQGDLTVIDSSGTSYRLGDGSGPAITMRFNTAQAERAVALNPALKLGECYMEGGLDMVEGTIYDLIMLAYRNAGPELMPSLMMKVLNTARVIKRRWDQMNTRLRARGNVKSHYDLSAELYRMFLDPDMQYSCAYFPGPDTSLEQAQLLKKRHIAAKLLMQDGMDVVDIGCGWGGMGMYLSHVAGAKVTGVTLSDEQLAVAQARAAREGAQDRVDFRIQDYRDIAETFDRIVSVGMFEHVGINHYDQFFRKSASLLRRDGVMLLHTIGRAEPPGATNPFLQKYIFPGGYVPALSEVTRSAEKSGLIVTDVEILRIHYAETLLHWRNAFMAQRDKALALYDEAFCRMWEFYLAGCEASFREGTVVVFQVQLAHRLDTVPVTRDYIAAEEQRLEGLERQRGLPGPAWPDTETGLAATAKAS